MIRLGLQIPSFTYPNVPDGELFERVADIAVTAEQAGFDSLWVMDHFYQIPNIGPRTDPMLESSTLLGGLAARTSRASLGAMVTGVTYRNPALLAKTITTLDIDTKEVSAVQWVFSVSEATGRVGPSGPLAAALDKAGIPWLIEP